MKKEIGKYNPLFSDLISLSEEMSSFDGRIYDIDILRNVERKSMESRRIITMSELMDIRERNKTKNPSNVVFDHIDIIAPAPRSLTIEINGACNLSCEMCPRDSETVENLRKRNLAVMPVEVFEKYVSDSFPLLNYSNIPTFERSAVVLYVQNEPFLDPTIQKKAKYVGKKGLGCVVSSNLNVDKSSLEFVTDGNSGISKLICSVNAFTEDTYRKINKGGSFNKVRENLKYLSDNRPDDLNVVVQMLVLSTNENEIENFKKNVEDMGLNLQLKSLNRYSKTISEDLLPVNSNISRYANEQEWMDLDVCSRLWRGPTIDVFGNQIMCCTSGYQKGSVIQKIEEKNVQDYWNSDKMQSFRYSMLKNGLNFNRYCKDCDSVLSFTGAWKGAGV